MTFAANQNAARAGRLFFITLIATTLFKVMVAGLIPLTGDEAYFLVWGRHPALGYYDHGPMTGWWLALFLQVSDSPLWIRLPAVLIPLCTAAWLRAVLRPLGTVRADLAATLFLLSPVNLGTLLLTTDTPLFAFTMLAGALAVAADRRQSPGLWLLAGFCLGLAFLSKYFAVLIGLAWAVWLLVERPRPGWRPLIFVLLGAAPAIALNVWWNYAHGWPNILFNILTRNGEAGFNPGTPLLYLLFWVLILGPAFVPLIIRGLRLHGWREGRLRLQQGAGHGVLCMAVVPTVVFGLVSMVQDVGFHWLLAFAPWAMLVVLAAAPEEHLMRTLRPAAAYASVLGLSLMVGVLAPTAWVKDTKYQASVVISRHGEGFIAALAPYLDDYRLASHSYTRAAMLAYHFGREVPVIGPGSFHGRQDDLLTDFRALDGRNIMLFSEKNRRELMRPWFEELEVKELVVQGTRYELLLGRGFRYAVYRTAVLQPVADHYYSTPAWLARWSPPADLVRRYDLTPAIR